MSGFNNYNCTIKNQVIGNVYENTHDRVAFIEQKLDLFLKNNPSNIFHSEAEAQKTMSAINDFKKELANKTPKKELLERSLDVLGSVSSAVSLVAEIRTIMIGLFS
ncbi:MAG: hypothetical protein WA080_01935 [Sulfuricurvum sp.]